MGSGGSTTTESTTIPWAPYGQQLQFQFDEARKLYDNPLEFYPESTVGPRSDSTVMANQAGAGFLRDPGFVGDAGDYLSSVLQGDFLGPNPYLQNVIDASSADVTRNFSTGVLPSIASRFGRAGRSGSPAEMAATGRATGELTDSLSQMTGNIRYRDYNERLGDMMRAVGLAPAIRQAEYGDVGQARMAGASDEAYSQQLLNDLIARFDFAQMEPEMRLDRFGPRISQGGRFGTTFAEQPGVGASPLGIMAGAASLITAGASLFGGPAGVAAAPAAGATGGGIFETVADPSTWSAMYRPGGFGAFSP